MKTCKNCGHFMEDKQLYCEKCGELNEVKETQFNQTSNVVIKKTNGIAIAGFVCSFFIPLLGWIFGGIGIKKSKETNSGYGLSLAAIIIASIGFVINFFLLME